jgi:hypothetical protein
MPTELRIRIPPALRGRLARMAGAVAVVLLAAAGTARAQGSAGLAGLLPELILREITLPAPTTPGLSHAVHFSPLQEGDTENPAVNIVDSFNSLLIGQIASLPLGSSAGGFTYSFDPALGTFRRASRSFGPTFAERAATIGRGRFSAGFNYQHASYDRFEGEDLRDGSIRFYLRHQECCTTGGPPVPPFFGVVQQPDGSRFSPFFEGDVIEAALSLRVSTDTFAMFANYGVTDRWDVALAVPIVRVDLEASVLATIQRLATASNHLIHTFELGNPDATQRSFARSGTATGLGDIVARTKFRLAGTPRGAVAVALDARLPTGNEDDLLGGSAQTKLFVVTSGGGDRLGHHFNIGYTFSGSSSIGAPTTTVGPLSLPDEFNYAGGVEFVASPRLTLLGDIIGRTLRDTGRLSVEAKPFAFQPQDASQPVSFATFDEFAFRAGNLNLLLGTVGVKFNPFGDGLISGSVLFPLTDAGLRSRWTTVVGFDYAF